MNYLLEAATLLGIWYTPAHVLALGFAAGKTRTPDAYAAIVGNPPFEGSDTMTTPITYTPEPRIHAYQPIHEALATWMQYMTFDQWVELYWEAQRRRAEKEEHAARRCADPFDYFGKPSGYVMPQREVTS